MEVANVKYHAFKAQKIWLSSVGFLKVGSVKGVERMSKKIHTVGWEKESSPSCASQRHTSAHCKNEYQGSTQK